ncbi:hypothetical protein NYZ99_18735 [Maribacter litopenaei]|uniref:Uncharacterized protein n=1 Tax=Maribacter litopenaei TaxID=2976127 RepID=A0ABY5Y8W5_9FLAO|nr:hypothetical protein [Maribacter litopenaei]UWX54797.1 hypothetical protein NYZ99_18735 [Maribacter litopenaei]
MKTTKSIFRFVLVFALFSLNGFGQQKEIISDTDKFDYLIGMEYSDVSELNGLVYKSRAEVNKDGIETSSTNFTEGDYQIITSESVRIDPDSNQRVYKIQDIIVLDGYYYICSGCYISSKKDYSIKSFHPFGNVGKETALAAFEINKSTGKSMKVNPTGFAWNSKVDKIRKKIVH